MRALLLAVVTVAVPAMAQAISGTVTATFDGFNEFGVPQATVTLALQCGLSCPPEAPALTYRVNGGSDAWYAAKRDERADAYLGAGFGSASDGQNVTDPGFKAGVGLVVKVKSATCHCGNRIGEGGYVDLESNVVAVPPWISADETMRQNDDEAIVVSAKPRGSDAVEVKLSGAGLDETRTLTEADYGTDQSIFVRFKPTQPGTLNITATLQPYGATRSVISTVTARDVPSGSGGGSGSNTGGGGGGPEEPEGCSSTGALSLVALGAWALRRRR